MALSDLLKDLDPKFASALSGITDSLREEFDRKLSATREELGLDAAVQAAEERPAEQASAEEAPAPAAAAYPTDLLDPVEELKHAVVEIDGATSQGDILSSLVSGCTRFASRCAVFLVRDGQVSGWTAHNFSRSDDDMRSISFAVEPGSPWESLAEGSGALALEAGSCAPICDALEAEHPAMGVLVPFVLNNQTAAGVYCDRLAGDEPPNLAALQLVTFVASQVLENLPVRDRASTSTLRLTGGAVLAPADSAGEPDGGHEPLAATETELDAPAEPNVDEIAMATEAGLGLVSEPAEDRIADAIDLPVAVPAPPEPPRAQPGAAIEMPQAALDSVDEDGPDALFGSDDEELYSPPAEVSGPPSAVTDLPVADPIAQPDPVPAADSDEPSPAILADSTTQVQPPTDLEGPGWAFTGPSASTPETGDESQHEEARRLARLLVTEVKLYNEELVEQGRSKGDVYSVLKEDIDRSRQIFEDRIAADVRSHSDYFREALVRILAGGDPSVLGA